MLEFHIHSGAEVIPELFMFYKTIHASLYMGV